MIIIKQNKQICVIGDVHGHLQLALCVAARLQEEQKVEFEAIFLCGDVGTFTHENQLDNATRRHAKLNPCELEFLHQWSVYPQPEWIKKIFLPKSEMGIGILCPVVMIHGNHEGFDHLRKLIPKDYSNKIYDINSLPNVDSEGHIKYLPSGFICKTLNGKIVGGLGGIQRNSRAANYDELAYIDELAILNLMEYEKIDILLTHQGPGTYQQDYGANSQDVLADFGIADVWCHCHAAKNFDIGQIGPDKKTTIVPLGDVAFPINKSNSNEPGKQAWVILNLESEVKAARKDIASWRDFRKSKWERIQNGQLICPLLVK